MTRENWIHLGLVAYLILFVGIVGGIFVWRIKRRGGRPPVDFKLLRGPGETLRRRIAKADEDALQKALGAALLPILVSFPVLWLVVKLGPQKWATLWIGLGVGAIVFLGTLIAALRWTLKDWKRYRDDRLGYLGEREVAEHLMPLLAKGYRIFHDVPAEGKAGEFNLDHVAVGPNGVAVIEVKTRRKGRPREGRKDYVVTYDGEKFIWPWGEDQHGLDQVLNEADWLRKFIQQRTGLAIPVRPILAFPGWWVEAPRAGTPLVVNFKSVAWAVESASPRPLSADEIDLIARQLDTLCRDVED